jgi:hypothetical protein
MSSGATRPMKKIGSSTVQTPAPLPDDSRRTPAKRDPRCPEAVVNASLLACAERNSRTGCVSAAALGRPASARASVATAIAATASQIHAFLCRFPVMEVFQETTRSSHIVPQMGLLVRFQPPRCRWSKSHPGLLRLPGKLQPCLLGSAVAESHHNPVDRFALPDFPQLAVQLFCGVVRVIGILLIWTVSLL